jgi:predicted dienelactone hydrolase
VITNSQAEHGAPNIKNQRTMREVGMLVTQARVFIRSVGLGLIMLGSLCCATAGDDTGNNKAGNRFHVGYRVLDFKYRSAGKERTLTVAVWYPTSKLTKPYKYGGLINGNIALDAEPSAEGPYPLLVFSHGYGGSGLGHVFLTEPLAARGWIVVAPDHNDKYSWVRIRSGYNRDLDRQAFWRDALLIAGSTPEDRSAYVYRLDEMKLVLDRILEYEPLAKLIDRKRIALGGHSFGGYTALGLCGTIEGRRDDRIKAILLFSTGAGGYLFTQEELAAVNIPSMYFLGEKERGQWRGTRTMAELAEKVYGNLPQPKYLLEIKGANHFSFNNRFTDNHRTWLLRKSEEQLRVIRRYSIAFLEKHVAGVRDASSVLEQHDPLLTRYVRESDAKTRQD